VRSAAPERGRTHIDWSAAASQGFKQELASSKEGCLGFNRVATGLDNKQKMDVRAYFSHIPFFMLEAGGERFYYAEGAVPVEDTWQLYKAMDTIGERLGFKLEVFVRDPRRTVLLDISTRLFVPKKGRWHFDGPKAVAGIRELLQG